MDRPRALLRAGLAMSPVSHWRQCQKEDLHESRRVSQHPKMPGAMTVLLDINDCLGTAKCLKRPMREKERENALRDIRNLPP